MSGAAIDRLAELIGLARGYWDIDGAWHEPAPDDRAALLEALGWPVGDPASLAAAVERLETESWRRALPPCQVVAEDTPLSLPLVLSAAAAAPEWRIELESGGIVTGVASPQELMEHRLLDGVALERRALALPPLPPGYHRLSVAATAAATALIVVPRSCHLPAATEHGGRVWGMSVQLYSVRSARNWGLGDFSDLARLARLAGRAGADLLGINPLHARSLGRPEDCSPYAAVSRLALDALSIDVEAVPEFVHSAEAAAQVAAPDFQSRLAALRAVPLVDYPGVAGLKRPVLRLLHQAFRERDPAGRQAEYRRFVEAGGAALHRYAEFEALRAWHDPRIGRRPWWEWPVEPGPEDPALAPEIDFELWLQFEADRQLAAAAEAGRAAGMRVGLYRDLAVGAARDGAEAWAMPELAGRASVGAPPDPLSRRGQNWGIPAPDPRALEAAGFAPFAALLHANMRHAGALRIDHAMSLARLFVIPPGRDGTAGSYLAYPLEALAGVLALESRRQGCLVVGEDLGTVPEGFRAAMAWRRVLSYKVLAFERYPDGAFRSPADYPALALATAATHDMPPLAGLWSGRDIAVRAALGLLGDMASAEAERREERRRLLALCDWQGVAPSPRPDAETGGGVEGMVAAIHRLIAASAAAVAMLQLDDILLETESVNIPGTSTEYPNWRRKLPLALDDPRFEDRFAAAAAVFAAARPRGRG